jgi:hypothetical protein
MTGSEVWQNATPQEAKMTILRKMQNVAEATLAMSDWENGPAWDWAKAWNFGRGWAAQVCAEELYPGTDLLADCETICNMRLTPESEELADLLAEYQLAIR